MSFRADIGKKKTARHLMMNM